MIIIRLLSIFLIIIFPLRPVLADTAKQVTVDINKDANNPRKRHYIVNKDIVSIAPAGYTEHIYENPDPFDITNLFFGRKKLESGTKELSAKMVEKVAVFWKFETPVLLYFKHSPSFHKRMYIYYRLTSNKTWSKVELTEEQAKNLPLSGNHLKELLDDILKDLGELPEDRPLPGVGSFNLSPIILPFIFLTVQLIYFS